MHWSVFISKLFRINREKTAAYDYLMLERRILRKRIKDPAVWAEARKVARAEVDKARQQRKAK